MLTILLGNICSIGAMIANSICATRKNNKELLLVQCISQVFYFLSGFILKGYSSCVQNVVGIARNLFVAKGIKNKIIEIILAILPVVLGIYFNNLGLMGILPIIANLEYSLAIYLFKNDEIKLKIAFIINMILYAVFGLCIYNFVSMIADIVAAVTAFLTIMKIKKDNNLEKE